MLPKLNCPACSAPLEYDGASLAMECPYCHTRVVAPAYWRNQGSSATSPADELRISVEGAGLTEMAVQLREVATLARSGRKIDAIKRYRSLTGASLVDAKRAVEALESGEPVQVTGSWVAAAPEPPGNATYAPAGRSGRGCALPLAVLLITLAILVIGFVAFSRSVVDQDISQIVSDVATSLPGVELPVDARAALTALDTNYAKELLRFGGPGIGPGKFEDARAIAVDGDGRIYVGEYSNGRVQVFDPNGEFLSQWSLGSESYVGQFAADGAGQLYVPDDDSLTIYDGMTGDTIGTVPPIDAETFEGYTDSVVIGPDGSLYAVWGDAIVRLDRDQNLTLRIDNAIGNATGGAEMTTLLAVNGLGEIYALGEMLDVVAKFAADGKFLDQFGGRGNSNANLSAGMAIATDSQGRVYVADIFGVKVYSPQGQYVGIIDTDGPPFGVVIDGSDNLYVAARDHVIKFALPATE
ncbi:MAG: hypothetical protein IPK16_16585 [Anaerolineales bacterium]|nr:hypothetical protein [Anaerolineales bacterium]